MAVQRKPALLQIDGALLNAAVSSILLVDQKKTHDDPYRQGQLTQPETRLPHWRRVL